MTRQEAGGAFAAPDLDDLRTDAGARRRSEDAQRELELAGPAAGRSQGMEAAPFLSTSTMSPAPMPFDVVRRQAAVGASSNEDCGSNDTPPSYVAARRLLTRRWSSNVLRAISAHADDRGPKADNATERGAERVDVLRLPPEPVQRAACAKSSHAASPRGSNSA
jgi:hypothetical protein